MAWLCVVLFLILSLFNIFHVLLVEGNTEKLGPHSAQVCCVTWKGPRVPSDRGSQSFLAPPCLTEFLCLKASSVLTCIFSVLRQT